LPRAKRNAGTPPEIVDEELSDKISRAGVEAARRKFTPEFMNRIDKTVVFRPLGAPELRKILAIELSTVQDRILSSVRGTPFVFSLTESAKDFLLREGINMKYGAPPEAGHRPVASAPALELIATEQVLRGDLIRVDFDGTLSRLTFFKDAEDMSAYAMAQMANTSIVPALSSYSAGAVSEMPRAASVEGRRWVLWGSSACSPDVCPSSIATFHHWCRRCTISGKNSRARL